MLEGYRTLIASLFAVGCLTVGLGLLDRGHRHEAYAAFGTAVAGIILAIAGKGTVTESVSSLAGGSGVKGAVASLMTDAKPEKPAGG